MVEKIRRFIENGKWKQLKKSDWAVIALIGVLLMVIAMPTAGNSQSGSKEDMAYLPNQAEKKTVNTNAEENSEDMYVDAMENKLKRILAKMDGVGKVEVMITVADQGEKVLEKDQSGTMTTTTESDSAGGSRTVTERDTEETTVYVETGDETYPYVRKEKLPEIEGIVVVAEGGGSSRVVSDISDAIKALFPVEAHRIKVVKMCSKEE